MSEGAHLEIWAAIQRLTGYTVSTVDALVLLTEKVEEMQTTIRGLQFQIGTLRETRGYQPWNHHGKPSKPPKKP